VSDETVVIESEAASTQATAVPLRGDEFDLDAVAAEAERDPYPFIWKGQRWVLRHASTIDLRTLEPADGGDLAAMRLAILSALGEEQAARFNAVPQDANAITVLFDRWTKHAGHDEGESSASPASFASTEPRSRPASRSTTRASGSGSSGKARSPRAS
jgi:hypothetical protein